MKRNLWIGIGIVVVVVLAIVLIVTQTKREPEEIKIGAIIPLTGDGAKYGESAKKGIDLAVQEINAAGGIKRKLIHVIYEDSKMDPKEGISAIRKLLTVEKVPAIIGAMASSVTLAIAPIAEKNKVVLLSPASSSPKITDAGDYIFRNTYSDIYEGQKMGSYAYNELGYRRVAVLYINNDYGVGLRKTFTESFTEVEGKVIITESYEQGAPDFRTQLTKIGQSKPDAIYIVGYGEMGRLLRQAKEIGMKTPFFSCIMFEDPDILKVAGESAEGVIYAYPAYNPESDRENISRFIQTFEKKYALKPNIYAASSYDALKILAQSMDKGGFTSEAIKEALYSIQDFPGITGKTSFDKNGDVTKPIGIKKVENGKFVWVRYEY